MIQRPPLPWFRGLKRTTKPARCRNIRFNCKAKPIYLAAALIAGVPPLFSVTPANSQDSLLSSSSDVDVKEGNSAPQKHTATATISCHFPSAPIAAQSADSNALAPKIFNSSIAAREGDIVFFQGANFTPSTRLFQDTPGGASSQIPIVNRVDTSWIAAEIPMGTSGAFQVRVVNDHGSSSAIKLNVAVPYHLDATQIVAGGRFRIFGRNLLHGDCKPAVSVGGYAAEVDATTSSDYMLDVRAPPNITLADAAEILVDNGAGLGPTALVGGARVVAGTGDPLGLNVGWAASFDFAKRVVTSSAACNGTTDDAAAIRQAISSASALGGAVVQLPKGTCRIAGTIDLDSKVVLRGAGRNETILRYEHNYPIYADSKDLVGMEDLQILNAGATQEGMIWRNNTRSFIRRVTINMTVSRQWFLTDNRDFVFDDNVVIQTGSYDQQNPYRFDRCVGLLFSNNRSINVTGSPTFQGLRYSAFLNNRFTRDASSQNETKVIAHHSFVIDFALGVSVIGNTFDVINGPLANKQRNDGETILIEGGGPNGTESLGVVETAGADFLADPDNPLAATPQGDRRRFNLGIAIVSGDGVGQTRHVVDYEDGRVKVEPPWDVVPEKGSHYSTFVWGMEKVLIIRNTLADNPRGIWLYQSSVRDVVIQGNEIQDGGGIFLRSFQDLASKVFTVQANTLIDGNKITNKTKRWMSHIILVCVSKEDTAFGIGQWGIEIRRNTVVANQPNVTSAQEDYAAIEGYAASVRIETKQPGSNFPPRIIGPIFQDNTCVNCERPFTVGVGVTGAIFSGNTPALTTDRNAIRDLDTSGRPLGGSMGTVTRY